MNLTIGRADYNEMKNAFQTYIDACVRIFHVRRLAQEKIDSETCTRGLRKIGECVSAFEILSILVKFWGTPILAQDP